MENFIQNILIGVRQWVNGKLEAMQLVISSHINELTGRVSVLESGATAMEAEISGVTEALSGKSNVGHTHQIAEVSGLTEALAGKSDTGHTHEQYSLSSHTHTNEQIAPVIIDDNADASATTKTFSAAKLLQLLGDISEFEVAVVEELPVSGQPHTIYFVPSEDSGATNVKDEYMWVDGQWEFIGTTKLDLSDYYTKGEVDAALSGKSDTGHTHQIADVSGLTEELASKQETLTAGDGIEISGNTISVIGMTVEEVLEVLNDDSEDEAQE